MPNIAIFGGTFSPVHWGHLLIAETAIDQFQLDRVIWVPSFHSPHKAQTLLAFEHRLEMVRRAIADRPAFTVSAVEEQQKGVSYAIQTLDRLQALEPEACWYWIVGNDTFQSLPKWHASEALSTQCIWLVAPRTLSGQGMNSWQEESQRESWRAVNNGDVADLIAPSPSSLAHSPSPSPFPSTALPKLCWHPLQTPLMDISSTLIRQRCQEGRSIRYLVPETVRCYIAEQNLYQMS